MHPLQRIDPTTGVRFWPSWSQRRREQLDEGLAGVAEWIDAGRSSPRSPPSCAGWPTRPTSAAGPSGATTGSKWSTLLAETIRAIV